MIEQVIAAVREAGRLIEEIRGGDIQAERKGNAGPVTAADRAADAYLKRRLPQIAPAAWLSEETVDDLSRLDQSRLWIVDPLDGTKEFIKGLPEYSVAVALVEAGRPVLGVVHRPAIGDTYWAERGGGVFRNEERVEAREGRRVLASRSEQARGEFDAFSADWEIHPVGSIQLKLAMVAAGEAALTLSRGPKHEWDVCAGALLVEEAGGIVTDVFGEPLVYNQRLPKTRGVMAGAREAYAKARALVSVIGASDRMAELER